MSSTFRVPANEPYRGASSDEDDDTANGDADDTSDAGDSDGDDDDDLAGGADLSPEERARVGGYVRYVAALLAGVPDNILPLVDVVDALREGGAGEPLIDEVLFRCVSDGVCRMLTARADGERWLGAL